jgi:hypothetical protein
MALLRRKSRAQKVTDALGTYAKVKAAKKAAKGAGKAAKGTAIVVRKTPAKRSIPIVAGLGIAAAAFTAWKLRSGPTAQPS